MSLTSVGSNLWRMWHPCKSVALKVGRSQPWWWGGVIRCMPAKLFQLCPILCNPMDCSTPASFVHGILQARILKGGCTLLQRIFPTQELNLWLLHLLQVDSLPLESSGKPIICIVRPIFPSMIFKDKRTKFQYLNCNVYTIAKLTLHLTFNTLPIKEIIGLFMFQEYP